VITDESDAEDTAVPNDTIAAETSESSDSSDSEDECFITEIQSVDNETDDTESEVSVITETELVHNEIPDPDIELEPHPLEMYDAPVPVPRNQEGRPIPVPRNLEGRPTPIPRRSLRNRVAPNRYGEWSHSHVANVTSTNEDSNSKAIDSHSHEVLGLLIDKFLDKLVTN
jgi:hypothetical protein